MATSPLGVGIIGVNATRGWAREAHVPAVQALAGLELRAVATRSEQSAREAAAAVGAVGASGTGDAPAAYGDPQALIDDPAVQIVTVAASVPAHRPLIEAALAAGKHVVTEWPVGVDTTETEALADAAARAGVRTAVGLQARAAPATRHAQALIASGAIGRVLSAGVLSSTAAFGPRIGADAAYLERPETGMNLPAIQLAHTADLALALAGALQSLAALATIQYPEVQVEGVAEPLRRTIPDHVLLQGRLADGGALSVEVAGGRPAGDVPFHARIVGETGVLELVGGAPRGFQSGRLRLLADGEPVALAAGETDALPDSVVNVAGVYAALRDEIADAGADDGRAPRAPSFADAVALAHLVDDARGAGEDGRRREPTRPWPGTPAGGGTGSTASAS